MEETVNQKYIRIRSSDFSGRSLDRSEESYFRSLEKYLEKNNESYDMGLKVCTIYVHDKNHAMRIGIYFNFPQLEYFDGFELSQILLKPKEKKNGRSKPVIFDETGEKMSLKNFKKQSSDKIEANYIKEQEVIKRGILTKREIKKAFADGKLLQINIANKRFVNRLKLANFLKNN